MRTTRPYRAVSLLLSIIMAALLAGCSINLDENGNIGISADETAPQPEKTAGVSENEPEAQSEKAAEPTGDIVILFTSDVHCGIDQHFGYDGLWQIRERAKAEGNSVLLVDNGDSIQGEPVGTMTDGESIIRLMNEMGYDVATIGNHEFDYGMEKFLELTGEADFPYTSCNFNKDGELVFEPYIIKEAAGKKIAFVGITTPETLTSSTPKYFQDENGKFVYGFLQDKTGQGLYDAVQKAVDDALKAGADFVIAMGHLGNEEKNRPFTYADVIANTSGIDAFIDGHSHDMERNVVKNKDGQEIIRQACGYKLDGIGYIRISAADDAIDMGLFTWENQRLPSEVFGFENKMTQDVADETKVLDEELGKVVAHTDVDLVVNDPTERTPDNKPVRIIRTRETNLGDLCADAIRDQLGADVAIINSGGIRDEIPKGDITQKEILSVHPFGNMISMIEVTGQQLLDALEWGGSDLPGENGGFLQVSGLTYEIDADIESSVTKDEDSMFTGVSGKYRVRNVKVGDEELDPKKTYTLASHEYMLFNHGDGFTMFDGCKVVLDRVKLDNQVLIDYITQTLGGKVGEDYSDPYGQGRIIIDVQRRQGE
ncbi:MAG: bifunctional metallophosphatase/5'-nucleotidase [Lachnospiraceae bacterium]|nr:bifunctional metallophosphatase/5'-nucleotidase [Lachnospiraceae bacterium]